MKTAAKFIDWIVRVVTGILAIILILYSLYVLYDTFAIGRGAFSSADLLQYKPSPEAEDDSPGFQELLEINPDVVGWLTIYGTNIDYPVLQGEDNLEYINKDVYGEFSLTGSIYLASENESTFEDDYNLVYGHNFFNDGYNLIYGHNITGGAMFGDIPNFLDKRFFDSHRSGLLQTADGMNFDLTVFACVRTDAYESLVYSMANRTQSEDPDLMAFIRENADVYDLPKGVRIDKLVALSTCAVTETNGRVVLFAYASGHEGEISQEPMAGTTEKKAVRRIAKGHGSDQGAWALLNLICVILTILTLLPLGYLVRKFRRLKKKKRRVIAVILELLLAIFSVWLFFYTENIRLPVKMIDWWTPWMILIFAAALLVDYLFFGGRYEPVEEEEEEQKKEEESPEGRQELPGEENGNHIL